MANIVLIQSLLFSFVMVQQQAGATQNGFMLLTFPLKTEPCLLRGQPPIRRDDYTYTPGFSGYKLHTRALKWANARLRCQEEGAHLAVINSLAEAIAIALVFEKSEPIFGSEYPNDAFIGFHDYFREGEYVTIHGESLEKAGYNQWMSGQPNGSEGQNCGGVHKNGRLNDLFCNKPFGFICEMPLSLDNDAINTVNTTSNSTDLE